MGEWTTVTWGGANGEEERIIEIEQGVGKGCKMSMGPKQEGKNFKTLPYEQQLKELKILSKEVKIYEEYDISLHIQGLAQITPLSYYKIISM